MALFWIFVAGFGSYAIASSVLLYFPQILHERKNGRFRRCRHISHRGGAGENYENTLTAFRHAINVGTDMLELDVHLTKDKKIVVNHDQSLSRTTGLKAFISDVNFEDLPLLKTSQTIDFDPGQVFVGLDNEEDRKIPLLSEVFKAFPDVMINIDIKNGNEELIHELNKLIVENQRESLTVWGSAQHTSNHKCYEKNPQVGLFFSYKRCMQLYFYFYTGLLPFIPLKETHLEICFPETLLKIINKKNSEVSIFRSSIFWLLSKVMLRPLLFRHLNQRGIQTYLWVLNDEGDFQRALDLGVTGIMTDYPTKLKLFYDKLN